MSDKLLENLKLLTDTLWQIEDKKLFQDLLEDLLTPKELNDLVDRINLIKLLNQGLSQREIAEQMEISVTTVNRGSRILQWGTGAAKKVLK